MQTTFHLPAALQEELDQFRHETERFQSGAISAAEYRALRVPRGVYEQRESDTYMLRVRFPAGVVLPEQMRALAKVARQYGNGVLHLTTRQDIQVHRVLLPDIYPSMVALAGAGLSTKGGGGNTVRNITGCADAGVCAHEAFDVSPYALALTEFLLPDPLSYQLPRKYKIAFSGCARDCAGATVNDLGFIAKQRAGSPGFAVYVGGGMGASSRVAQQLEEFVAADEVYLVAEAVKRVFDQHGNRRNRHKARLRYLLERIGLDRFRELYQGQLAAVRRSAPPRLAVHALPERQGTSSAGRCEPSQGFAAWRRQCVAPQRQAGYYLVHVPLALGNIGAENLAKLADVVERYGDGMVRTTLRQGLVIRWTDQTELVELHANLHALDLAATEPAILRNMMACAGAATCRLGICLSRGLAQAVHGALGKDGPSLERLNHLQISISGCPNACGRHPVADIGLFGAARRVEGRLVPHYVLQLGGRVAEGQTRLAQGTHAIPARNVPSLLVELLSGFRQSDQCPDFAAFLQAQGRQLVDDLAGKYKEVPQFAANKDYYYDWGAQEMCSLAGRGPGECGAGVFDLIEVDLAGARDALGQNRLFAATVLAARCLLVTRGQQAHEAAEVLELFTKHFLQERLLDESFAALVSEARQAAAAPQPEAALEASPERVVEFVAAIQRLYEQMDASLRFKPAAGPQGPAARAGPEERADCVS